MKQILSFPSKWDVKRLEEIAANTPYPIGDGDHGQIKPRDYTDKGIPYIRVGDIGWGQFLPEKMVYIPIEVHLANQKSKLLPGDILLAKTGATIGKCCIIPDSIYEANTTSSVGKVTVDTSKVLPKWVLLWFLTPNFLKYIWSISNRAAQPGFNNRDIKLFKIPIPPLPEQQRIVTILEEAFAAIDKVKANAEKNLKNAKELFESYLQGVFENKGEGWEEKTLGEIGKPSMCKRILKHQTSPIGDIPFYKIGTFGKKPDAFISKDLYNEFRKKYSFPKKGDILISASGTIGRRVRYDGEPAFFQDSNIVWIDNNEKQVLNDYLYVFYEFCDWQPSKGATISRLYNINLTSIKVSFPKSKEEQKILLVKIDALSAETKRLESIYQKKLTDLEELKKSILQKAFNGELSTADICV